MSAFDRLHPALRHHIVNSLCWQALRPVQEMAIDAVLDGANLLVLAPTAGGKTEAVFFPLISEALVRPWDGLAALYVSPIRALLNNQRERLERYYGLVGRRVEVWHGDVLASAKRRILTEPPDCLLTTPESLEAMLVSASIGHGRLFAHVRAIVVDEVHAFASGDRGWHLLALVQRISRLAGRDLLRIGLSATVGNAPELLEWLSAGSDRPRRLIQPPSVPEPEPKVVLDYVGHIENAATVIAALHRGEKRLVFCDSRARVERLGAELRLREVETFVAHSSLGAEERRSAEQAFAQGRDCVIVATSALELGLDIGDLDRVIQIDAPGTVSSFLQRMGRTGRRPGKARNATFLATSDDGLLRAAGLLSLWRSGSVEPAVPPPRPLHILAQQLLALTLQERGIGRSEWLGWVREVPAFGTLERELIEQVVAGMLDRGILWEEAGVLWLGREGQDAYGRRNFLDLVSVFTAPPLFTVLHGRHELGSVDESTFLARQDDGPPVLLLAGRAWRVSHLDWKRRKAYVEPAETDGRSRWRGEGQYLGHSLCRAIRGVLAEDEVRPEWSRRAVARMVDLRAEYPWLRRGVENVLVEAGDELSWWTFAGGRANAALAAALVRETELKIVADNFAVRFPRGQSAETIELHLRELRDVEPSRLLPAVGVPALEGLKFSECLPQDLAEDVVRDRLADLRGVATTLGQPTRWVRQSGD